MTHEDYTDDQALLVNTPAQSESLQQSLAQTAGGIGLYVKANETELCLKEGVVSTLRGKPLTLVDWFTYIDSNILSTDNDVNIRREKT